MASLLPPCRLISVPGVTENVRNSEDCIWVTIMLTNGKPIKACSLQRWPSLQTSNVFNIFQLIFNNGCQQWMLSTQISYSHPWGPSQRLSKNEIISDPLNWIHTHPPVDIVVNCAAGCNCDLYFDIIDFSPAPDPLFYSHYAPEHLLDLIQRERERFKL